MNKQYKIKTYEVKGSTAASDKENELFEQGAVSVSVEVMSGPEVPNAERIRLVKAKFKAK